MALSLRRKAANALWVVLDLGGLLLSASGAAVVSVLGKLMLGVVLGAIALGFFLRLVGRRRMPPVAVVRTPGWCSVVSALLALVEVAVLVEATDLPVRFHQPGFALYHWALVLVALAVAYTVQMQLLRAFARKRGVTAQQGTIAR